MNGPISSVLGVCVPPCTRTISETEMHSQFPNNDLCEKHTGERNYKHHHLSLSLSLSQRVRRELCDSQKWTGSHPAIAMFILCIDVYSC